MSSFFFFPDLMDIVVMDDVRVDEGNHFVFRLFGGNTEAL